MVGLKDHIIKSVLKGLYYTGSYKILRPLAEGCGVIFMLHQVGPAKESRPYNPNGILTVTPEFLETVIEIVLEQNIEIISLDDAYERLKHGFSGDRFVCFTFDDGYRDNYDYAYPLFKKHNLPFTVYVSSDYANGKGELWWLALEEIIKRQGHIQVTMDQGLESFRCFTEEEKLQTYYRIYWRLRHGPELLQRQVIRNLCERYDFDLSAQCQRLIMDWDVLRGLAADPLVSIGGHTAGHYALGKLGDESAYDEMDNGLSAIKEKLGFWPQHFAYPYGDMKSAGPREFQMAKQLRMKTAVTTRKGMLFRGHGDYMTALPRVSLNGNYQDPDFVRLYLAGVPFALWNCFRRLNVS